MNNEMKNQKSHCEIDWINVPIEKFAQYLEAIKNGTLLDDLYQENEVL